MTDTTTTDTTKACEAILRATKENYEGSSIWPSRIVVIDRILERRLEMVRAYREVHDKLIAHPHALSEFWGVLLSTTGHWNPESNAEARAGRDRLIEVNEAIADLAGDLAELLAERSELRNTSGFRDDTHYSVFRILDAAAADNGLYRLYLRKSLKALSAQYDLRYWPTPAVFVQAIADDADIAEPYASDPLTEAATRSARASKADFFKALFVAIDENRVEEHGCIPDDFKLTDETLASLANAALGLEANDLVDGAYVKRLRQRERDGAASEDDMA